MWYLTMLKMRKKKRQLSRNVLAGICLRPKRSSHSNVKKAKQTMHHARIAVLQQTSKANNWLQPMNQRLQQEPQAAQTLLPALQPCLSSTTRGLYSICLRERHLGITRPVPALYLMVPGSSP
ncbi:hypothetical protein NW754_001998 [Fusarium falciforme]|nr:hypothetical protein NW754_001998 [Fusarium falciforme]